MADKCTVVSLSLTEDYAPSWGVWEGTRELLQNWHDGCLDGSVGAGVRWQNDSDEPATLQRFEAVAANGCSVGTAVYDPVRERLLLVNRDVELQRRVLLLGASEKAHTAESIGQFGEGLKVGTPARCHPPSSSSPSWITSQTLVSFGSFLFM